MNHPRFINNVLVALGVATLPHYSDLPIWMYPFIALCGWWRWSVGSDLKRLPQSIVRSLGTLALLYGSLLWYGFQLNPESGTTMLIGFSWFKLIEAKQRRDYLVQHLLALIIIGALVTRSHDIWVTLYTVCALLVCLASLHRCHISGEENPAWKPSLRRQGVLVLKSLPVIIFMFLFLPRPQAALGLPLSNARTGVSDHLLPGSVASLARNNSLAFRVEFPNGVIPPAHTWYWRGPVLWDIGENGAWLNEKEVPRIELDGLERIQQFFSETIEQRITIEPHGNPWVFSLDHPCTRPEDYFIDLGGTIIGERLTDNAIAYTVQSTGQPATGLLAQGHHEFIWTHGMRVPARIPSAVQDIADTWRQNVSATTDIIANAQRWYLDNNFTYTLNPGVMGKNPVETFLLEKRSGFCGHYATSFALVMRLIGVPTRIINGYRGGVWNEMGSFIEVRNSTAHSWCEVYDRDSNAWIRVDPTEGIPMADGSVRTQNETNPLRSPWDVEDDSVWESIQVQTREWLSYIDYKWDNIFLGYDAGSQRGLLYKLGLHNVRMRYISIAVFVLAVLFLFVIARWLPHRRREPDPIQRQWISFLHIMDKKGCPKEHNEAPNIYAQRACLQLPEQAVPIQNITQSYITARYTQTPNRKAALQEMHNALRQLK